MTYAIATAKENGRPRRRMTEDERAEVDAAVDAAIAGGVGTVRYICEEDREWLRLRVLHRARRLGVPVRTRGRDRVGALVVRV